MKHNQKTSEQEIVDFIESINLGDYPKKVLIKKVRTVFKNENEELQQLKQELNRKNVVYEDVESKHFDLGQLGMIDEVLGTQNAEK